MPLTFSLCNIFLIFKWQNNEKQEPHWHKSITKARWTGKRVTKQMCIIFYCPLETSMPFSSVWHLIIVLLWLVMLWDSPEFILSLWWKRFINLQFILSVFSKATVRWVLGMNENECVNSLIMLERLVWNDTIPHRPAEAQGRCPAPPSESDERSS